MNLRNAIFFTVPFLLAMSAPLQAQQEAVSPSALAYPRIGVSTRNSDDVRRDKIIKVPKAERPENNVSDMSPKAREQFERNEAEMRKKLGDNAERWDKESEWRRKHLRGNHDDDHDRDHEPRWHSTTAMQNGAFVPQTVRSDNKGRRHHHRHHRHYRYNYHSRVYIYEPVATVVYDEPATAVEAVPAGYDSLIFGGVTYYFKDGQFFVPSNGDIVEVLPPLGAVVPRLPEDSVIIESNGTFYVYNGLYYRKTWGGYEVIAPPFDPHEYDGVPMSSTTSPEILVRIPDDDGKYTEVKLVRTTRGFRGPQGEIYREFPLIEQLEEIYGENE